MSQGHRHLPYLLGVLLAGCASAPPRVNASQASVTSTAGTPKTTLVRSATQPPELSPPGISMGIFSWSKLIASFNARANGDIEYREASGREMYNYDVNIKRFNVGPDGFALLQAKARLIADRVPAAGGIDCGRVSPDGPYGTFKWDFDNAKGAIPLQYGCQTEEGGRVLTMINELEKVVIDWAATHPVVEVEQVREPT